MHHDFQETIPHIIKNKYEKLNSFYRLHFHLIEVNQPINQTFYQHGAHFNFISKPTPGFKQNFSADISVHIFRFLFVNAFVHPLSNGSVQSPSLHPS